MSSPTSRRARASTPFAVAAAAFLLASPLRHLWAADERPWYLPFVIWLGVIALPVLLERWGREP